MHPDTIDMAAIYQGIIITLASGILIAIVKQILKTVKAQVESIEGITKATYVINRDKLFRFSRFYIETNQITLEEKEDLRLIYDAYKGLGGNHAGDDLFRQAMALPTVSERTEFNPYYAERYHPRHE